MMENDRKKQQIYAAVSVGCALLAILFYVGLRKEEAEIHTLRASNEAVEAYERRKKTLPESREPFVIPKDALEEAAEAIRREGFAVEDVSEPEPERMQHGEIRSLKLEGTGHFEDILTLFDIVHAQRYWLLVDVENIRREGAALRYVVEIREYRSLKEEG